MSKKSKRLIRQSRRDRKAFKQMSNIFDSDKDWACDADGVYRFIGTKTDHKGSSMSTTKTWESGYSGHGAGYGGYDQYGNYNSSVSSKASCNHKPKEVKVGNFVLWPTKELEVDDEFLSKMDVACPLTDYGSTKPAYDNFCGLLMWIPIKDYGVPAVHRLIANARRINQFAAGGARVALWCVGSHGRTGLVLATCIGLAEPDVDPIDAVRERHCSHCVETQSQVEMVFKALGRDLPEKWKPKAAKIAEPPVWLKDGKAWSPETEKSAKDILTGSNVCDLCLSPPAFNGLGILHWFGDLCCHDSCYANAVKEAESKKEAKAPELSSTVTDLAKIPSNNTPTSDAPTYPKTHSGNQHTTNVGFDTLNGDNNGSLGDDTFVDTELFKAAVAQERPFRKDWSAKQQKRFANVLNNVDQFGDMLCAACKLLITDPFQAQVGTDKKEQTKKYAFHNDCNVAKMDIDSVPLCKTCYDGPADEDGYCSEVCLNEAIMKAAAESGNSILDVEKDPRKDTTPVAKSMLAQAGDILNSLMNNHKS